MERMKRARVVLALAISVLAWSCASAPPAEQLRPVHAPEPPPQAEDPDRPGGPFDVKPVHAWEDPDGGPHVWPMSHPESAAPATESSMPGAFSPH